MSWGGCRFGVEVYKKFVDGFDKSSVWGPIFILGVALTVFGVKPPEQNLEAATTPKAPYHDYQSLSKSRRVIRSAQLQPNF